MVVVVVVHGKAIVQSAAVRDKVGLGSAHGVDDIYLFFVRVSVVVVAGQGRGREGRAMTLV